VPYLYILPAKARKVLIQKGSMSILGDSERFFRDRMMASGPPPFRAYADGRTCRELAAWDRRGGNAERPSVFRIGTRPG
jgi:hypothetical protein